MTLRQLSMDFSCLHQPIGGSLTARHELGDLSGGEIGERHAIRSFISVGVR